MKITSILPAFLIIGYVGAQPAWSHDHWDDHHDRHEIRKVERHENRDIRHAERRDYNRGYYGHQGYLNGWGRGFHF